MKKTQLDVKWQSDKRNITLFVPSNDAFKALRPTLIRRLQDNPVFIKNFVDYHAIVGKYTMWKFRDEMLLPSLNAEKKIRFNIYNRGLVSFSILLVFSYMLGPTFQCPLPVRGAH